MSPPGARAARLTTLSPMPPPSAAVMLLRHGETEWSRSGQHTGRSDIPLTDRGRAQAGAAAAPLAGHHFSLVLVSPLSRARQTADLAGLGDRAEICDDLAEWDYGEIEGRTTDQVRADHPGWQIWRDGAAGGETVEQVGERADRVIARVRIAGGDVALIAHGHLLRILAARWLGLPPVDGRHLALDTASISQLGSEHEWPVIRRWNDVSHLAGI